MRLPIFFGILGAMADFIANSIGKMAQLASSFYENIQLLDTSWLQILVDISLIAVLFYYLFILIRETRAYLVLKGLIVLGVILVVSKVFSLIAVNWLLNKFLATLVLAIPIIFQQELREGLERLGRTRRFISEQVKEADFKIRNIIEACEELKKEKKGALIVFENSFSLSEYIESGVEIDGKITKDLILAIFQKDSPLHDGAIIIQNGVIASAASLLPHSFKNYGNIHGTRHKAALSLSESTDAKIIVISEERGVISWIEKGRMDTNISAEKLAHYLSYLKPKAKSLAKKPELISL